MSHDYSSILLFCNFNHFHFNLFIIWCVFHNLRLFDRGFGLKNKMILFYSILFCFNCYISFHYVLFDLISLYYFGPIFSTQFCFVLFFPKYWILRASAYFFKILFNHAFDFHFWDWQTTKNNIVEIQGDFLWWCRHFYCVHCYVLLFLMLTFLVNCGSLHILTLYFFSSPNLIQAKKVTVSNHLVIIGS